MQRKLSILCLGLFMFAFISRSHAQAGKSEFSFGYGYWSIYSLANGTPFNTSSGDPVFTYRYYVSRMVTLGMGFCYENITSMGSWVSVCPELTVAYMDTRKAPVRIRMYGAVSYGVAIYSDANVGNGEKDLSGVKPYGFQATPFGIRVGGQFAGFAELGCGYKGLVNAGIDVRVPRHLRAREKPIEY